MYPAMAHSQKGPVALLKTCTFSFKWIIIKIYLGIAFEMEHSIVNLIYHKNTLYPVLKFMFSKKATKILSIVVAFLENTNFL